MVPNGPNLTLKRPWPRAGPKMTPQNAVSRVKSGHLGLIWAFGPNDPQMALFPPINCVVRGHFSAAPEASALSTGLMDIYPSNR